MELNSLQQFFINDILIYIVLILGVQFTPIFCNVENKQYANIPDLILKPWFFLIIENDLKR